MSYILDALRKSDLQRRRGAAPMLLSGPAVAAAPKQPALLAYGLLAALLVGAGMAIGWLRPWQPEQAAPGKAELVAAKPAESTPRQAAPTPSEMPPQPKPELRVKNAAPPAHAAPALVPAKPQAAARAKPKTDGTRRKAAAPAPAHAVGPAGDAARAQAVDPAADAARAQPVISLAELPFALQQELPAMTVSVHAYSANPRDRMVGINNRMLREGENVVPGLKLEQITPDGMIFGYKGYSFRRGVK